MGVSHILHNQPENSGKEDRSPAKFRLFQKNLPISKPHPDHSSLLENHAIAGRQGTRQPSA